MKQVGPAILINIGYDIVHAGEVCTPASQASSAFGSLTRDLGSRDSNCMHEYTRPKDIFRGVYEFVLTSKVASMCVHLWLFHVNSRLKCLLQNAMGPADAVRHSGVPQADNHQVRKARMARRTWSVEVGDLPAQILRYNGDMLAPSLCEPQEWTANSGVAAACADTTAGLLRQDAFLCGTFPFHVVDSMNYSQWDVSRPDSGVCSRLMNESVLHARA